tara:strand:- start:656 stop:1255 length:600 start_codon:yes stop_codon:yes gene_type:complete
MEEFLASITDGEKFACPTHQGRRKGTFGVNGAKRHITWCTAMQTAYAVASPTAPKAKAKAKPSVIEDSAIRGWASKPRTVRRDARQAEEPVAQQDNKVRSASRVRVTSGYVDPATVTHVDKNGNPLKGQALKNRLAKIERDAKAPTPTAPAPTSEVHSLADISQRVAKLEVEVANFQPVVQALQTYVAAHEDMIEDSAS